MTIGFETSWEDQKWHIVETMKVFDNFLNLDFCFKSICNNDFSFVGRYGNNLSMNMIAAERALKMFIIG